MQEILRLVVAGHTTEQIAAPALNPFMRQIVRGKLAPPPSCTAADEGPGVNAAAFGGTGAATAAAGDDGAATNKDAAHQATTNPRAAGTAVKHGVGVATAGDPQPLRTAASANLLDSTGVTPMNMAAGLDDAADTSSKEKLWTRSAARLHVADPPTKPVMSCVSLGQYPT